MPECTRIPLLTLSILPETTRMRVLLIRIARPLALLGALVMTTISTTVTGGSSSVLSIVVAVVLGLSVVGVCLIWILRGSSGSVL